VGAAARGERERDGDMKHEVREGCKAGAFLKNCEGFSEQRLVFRIFSSWV
jgi:hypothetical protein